MQIPILNGTYTDEAPDFRSSYPRNLVPVPKEQGVSKGYLRPAEGIELFGTGPGFDRGGIVWRKVHYRVMGQNLVRVETDGTVAILGFVGGHERVRFDYSFDRLILGAGGGLYYWNGVLTQVSDPDLGNVVDVLWVDGYTMTTDGESLVVADLNDPTSVNPFKYGGAEADPDPVMALLKIRKTPCAVGRFTIEMFDNVGGNLFPFQPIEGAQIQRGAIGTHCAALLNDAIVFLGGGRGEPPAVWLGLNATSIPLSTREIDTILLAYSEAELAASIMEVRTFKKHQQIYLHLPDQCLVYDVAASAAVEEPVWYHLTSSIVGNGTYRARDIIWCDDKWLCGDPTSANLGQLVDTVSTHYGQVNGWEFGTTIIYNRSKGAIVNQMELVALPGRVPLGADPVVWTSYSIDGETWSEEEACSAGQQGERLARLTWLMQGCFENWRIQRFRGTTDAHAAFARLEVELEPLNV